MVACSTCAKLGDDGDDESDDSELAEDRGGASEAYRAGGFD